MFIYEPGVIETTRPSWAVIIPGRGFLQSIAGVCKISQTPQLQDNEKSDIFATVNRERGPGQKDGHCGASKRRFL